MSKWQLHRDNKNRNEWTRGDYSIVEMRRPIDEKEYFIYHKGNFITVRLTPECAMELCDVMMGKL